MKKRGLIKDWQPLVPTIPHTKGFKFSQEDNKWDEHRRVWLLQNYSESEDWRLAQCLNTDEETVVAEARKMKLKKSKRFLHWQHQPPTKEKGCMAGFHWETDEEFEKRLAQEREHDRRVASWMANTYDFCDKAEKNLLVQVLMEVMEWGRDSQPDLKYDYEYWN